MMRTSLAEAPAAPASATRLIAPWLPALFLMAVIFWLSSLPGDEVPLPDFRFSDKLVHFAAYAALGLAIAARRFLGRRLAAGPASVPAGGEYAFDSRGAWVGMLYGLSDEAHQLFVPLRFFSWSDFVADALGVAAGIWVCGKLERRADRGRRRGN